MVASKISVHRDEKQKIDNPSNPAVLYNEQPRKQFLEFLFYSVQLRP